jgi:hypothetical protein
LFGTVLLCALCVVLAGCGGDGLEGTYHTDGGGFTLDFKDGKVTVTTIGESETFDYKVDGNKITIVKFDEGKDLELTRNSDGSLNSPVGTFTNRK